MAALCRRCDDPLEHERRAYHLDICTRCEEAEEAEQAPLTAMIERDHRQCKGAYLKE